ncbi:DMT family transporter [Roseibium denhamense]|uniref:DMT family transporter n=1 Tax=Roseibium denhamense TaxID=76305 RepID=UPI001FCB59EA|nr:DMT family transporter [Roseibium denhamense]
MSSAASIPQGPRANLVGSLLMVLSMGLFALEDMFIKKAATGLPVGEILILFGAGGAVCFYALALVRRERIFVPDVLSKTMLVRFVFELTGRLFYTLSLALTSLSSTTAILQATPIVVVMGAALFFGETVGWRRWTAIITGLIGVMIVLQPGSDAFSALSILAVIGMIGFAGRDLASRAAPPTIGTNALGFYGFLTLIMAGIVVALWDGHSFEAPSAPAAIALTGAVLAGVGAYAALMKAMRTGDVSSVTPFRYSRLLFGVGLGVFFFDEAISQSMLLGCGLIVASGLFILVRGRKSAVRTQNLS